MIPVLAAAELSGTSTGSPWHLPSQDTLQPPHCQGPDSRAHTLLYRVFLQIKSLAWADSLRVVVGTVLPFCVAVVLGQVTETPKDIITHL